MAPPDLGLDLKLSTTRIIESLAEEDSPVQNYEQKVTKIEQSIKNFEEERRKVEVFKRDLPFCMFLLNDVIDGLKSELEQCRRRKHNVVEELFMPVKSSKTNEESSAKTEYDCKDKMNWMSSAQLWSDSYSNCTENNKSANGIETQSKPIEESRSAFVPFKDVAVTAVRLPDLSLVCEAVSVVADEEQCISVGLSVKTNERSCHVSDAAGSQAVMVNENQEQQLQGSKKARRCWSPELHRRFVAALQQLGGPQVATPKQIRELMKVDGLTNDEVKSHLQKYRLHTRRVPNATNAMNQNPNLVAGDLWSNNEKQKYTKSHQSGSPQGPLQMNSYSRAMSVTNCDSCEDDGKSESCNWK